MRRHQLSILALARLLTRHVHSRTHGRESGAVATLVAIMLGTGVILGCAALTIDTGSLLWERRQLQNGADAASLAAAQACATQTPCNPSIAAGLLLSNLANANASDNATGIESICGSATTVASNPALALCPAPGGPGELVKCPAVPSSLAAGNYVEIRTRTLTSGGSTILPPYLAQTLAGGGYSGETVRACARAAWGPPGSVGVSLPITLSSCEWANATLGTPPAATPTYAAAPVGAWPGYGGGGQPAWPAAAQTPPVPGHEVIIMLQDPQNPQTCQNWNGHDVAGGFGYLQAANCQAVMNTGDWVKVDTGNSLGCDISTFFNKIVYLPVFDCVAHQNSLPAPPPPTGASWPVSCYDTQGGGNHWYHVEGFAKFYLSGYKVGGGPADTRARTATGTEPCTGSQRCLSGWFLEGLVPASSISQNPIPGPVLGSYAVQVAG